MGTDIHTSIETRISDGVWREMPDYHCPPLFDWRDYGMFGFLADIRNDAHVPVIAEPRGLPEDCSPEVAKSYAAWGVDGHTPSWLTLAELQAFDYDLRFWNRRAALADEGEGTHETIRELLGPGYFDELCRLGEMWPGLGADNVRIVFWFDS